MLPLKLFGLHRLLAFLSFFFLLRDLIKVCNCFIFIVLKNTHSKMIKIPVQVHSSRDKENDNASVIKNRCLPRPLKLLSVDIHLQHRFMVRVWRKLRALLTHSQRPYSDCLYSPTQIQQIQTATQVIHFYSFLLFFNIFRSAIDIVSRENISVIVFTIINPL